MTLDKINLVLAPERCLQRRHRAATNREEVEEWHDAGEFSKD